MRARLLIAAKLSHSVGRLRQAPDARFRLGTVRRLTYVTLEETTVTEGLPAEPTDPDEAPAAEAALPFADHVERRTVVLPEQRILFLPMPKAGCTSVLWLLAELAGIPPRPSPSRRFPRSRRRSPSTT